MEPIEPTDRQVCEHCGYVAMVRNFRRPGKRGPNFVCPSCYFSSETYDLYIEDKYMPEQYANAGFAGHYRKKLSSELYQEYEKIERRIAARRAGATQSSGSGCLLLLFGIPATLLIFWGS